MTISPQALAAALRGGPAAKSSVAEILAAREAAERNGDPQPLSNIFNYIDNEGTHAYAVTPNNMTGGEQGWGSTGFGVRASDPRDNSGSDGNLPQAPVTFDPGATFRHGITLSPQSASGEGGGGYRYNVDGSQFPRTRFGDVTGSAPVGQGTRLWNDAMQYNDPNYGQITDARNVDSRSIADYVWPAIMAATSWGMGSLGAGAGLGRLAMQAPGLARGLANGGLRGGAGGILGILGSAVGAPGWATTLGRMALSQALQRKGRD